MSGSPLERQNTSHDLIAAGWESFIAEWQQDMFQVPGQQSSDNTPYADPQDLFLGTGDNQPVASQNAEVDDDQPGLILSRRQVKALNQLLSELSAEQEQELRSILEGTPPPLLPTADAQALQQSRMLAPILTQTEFKLPVAAADRTDEEQADQNRGPIKRKKYQRQKLSQLTNEEKEEKEERRLEMNRLSARKYRQNAKKDKLELKQRAEELHCNNEELKKQFAQLKKSLDETKQKLAENWQLYPQIFNSDPNELPQKRVGNYHTM